MNDFIIKGDICYAKNMNKIEGIKDGYLICQDGISKGIFENIPQKYEKFSVYDYSGKLVIPGLCDMHTHAPQHSFIGLGMDYELMDWLEHKTYPEEIKYSDITYAEKAYNIFAEKLLKSVTTRACIFATVHEKATIELMKILDKTGLYCYIGKVGMDREAPEELCESKEKIISDYENILENYGKTFKNINVILTPRFIPCCSNELLKKMSELREKYNLPVQSHLSENLSEVKLVKELCPDSAFYGDAYDSLGLFGKSRCDGSFFNTVMAHCVYPCDEEIKLMAENNVFAAHCPSSNMNLASGIAPVRKMLESGVKVALGTDAAAGSSLSLLRAITDAVQVSKLYYCLIDSSKKPLTFSESFFMASKGGGEFFGKVGSFEEGYELDAVILNDEDINFNKELTPAERLERFAYLSGDSLGIKAKYVKGLKVYDSVE